MNTNFYISRDIGYKYTYIYIYIYIYIYKFIFKLSNCLVLYPVLKVLHRSRYFLV